MALLTVIFPVEIWGTVSDWFMVGVTVVTAYYLYRTLKSQKEVQQVQYELFKIESVRFRESIKPVLKFKGSTSLFVPGEEGKKILTIEVTNETESMACDISKRVETSDQTTQLFIALDVPWRNYLSKGDPPLLYHFLIKDDSILSSFIVFSIFYKDVAGTTYCQGVFCICDNQGIDISPFLPKIAE